jgi:hypothetical protein
MQIALIPPISLRAYTYGRPMQMALPNPANDFTYMNYYKRMGRGTDSYVILDNGMFEKPILSSWKIGDLGRTLNAQEIVLPDVWANPVETLVQVQNFLEYWKKSVFNYTKDWSPRLQVVVHGGTMRQAKNFVTAIADNAPTVSVIGISRSLSRSCRNVHCRIELTEWIHKTFPNRYEIHFLGFDDNYHEELRVANAMVRSVDTGAPFIAAYWKHHLSHMGVEPRPRGYFRLPLQFFEASLVSENIEYLDDLVRS